MVEKPSSHPWTAVPWLPWGLGLALFTIVGSHLVAWFNSTSLTGMIRTQQELFVGLTEYQGMLSDLDESTRAIMLAPERSELRRKKAEAVEALQHQLGVLAEMAPIGGPIPKGLIGLATHFRKKLVPQADQVQKHAAAPGPFAMDRFRTEYAEVRLQHAERLGELFEETRKLAEQSVSSGQHRLLLSAGLLLLLWSGAMVWLVGRARLHPQPLDLAPTEPAPSSVEHAAPPSAGSHDSAHGDHSIPSAAPEGHGEIESDLVTPLAPEVHTPSPPAPVAVSLADPTAPPPQEPDLTPASASRVTTVGEVVSPTVAAPPEISSPSASGELSQSQIADLLQPPSAADSASASSPAPSPSAVTPLSTTPVTATVAAAPTPASIPTPTPTPTSPPVAAAPAVLPPGPVDLASLMGEAVEEPAVSPSPVSEAPPDPAAPVQQPAVPVPAASAPAAVQPAPLPDVQTLMKGASAMTTEQLSAMLFGVAPASPPPPPAPAKTAPSPAPAAAPAAPPRTITGAEMATLKPGDDAPPVVDLSF